MDFARKYYDVDGDSDKERPRGTCRNVHNNIGCIYTHSTEVMLCMLCVIRVGHSFIRVFRCTECISRAAQRIRIIMLVAGDM